MAIKGARPTTATVVPNLIVKDVDQALDFHQATELFASFPR